MEFATGLSDALTLHDYHRGRRVPAESSGFLITADCQILQLISNPDSCWKADEDWLSVVASPLKGPKPIPDYAKASQMDGKVHVGSCGSCIIGLFPPGLRTCGSFDFKSRKSGLAECGLVPGDFGGEGVGPVRT